MAHYSSLAIFSFALDSQDGRYALTNTTPQYPISDARDELFARPLPRSPSPSSPAPATRHHSFDLYPVPDLREVVPGVLVSTGQLTDNHPLVSTYLDVLVRLLPRGSSKVSASSASSPAPAVSHLPSVSATGLVSAAGLWTPKPQPAAAVTFWQSEHAGIASWNTVSNLILQQFQLYPSPTSRLYAAEVPKLTTGQQQSIFALAALKVLNHPTHPAHFAFWAKNSIMRTAETVDTVLQLNPCPIVTRVGWMGIQENLWALRGLQSMYIPPEPKGMTLRKRRAPAVTATQVEDEPAEPRVNTRKRARTTRASQKAKEAEAAQAAEVVPDAAEEPEEEQASSLLFSSGQEPAIEPAPYIPSAAPTLEFMTRAVKEDLMSGSPMLQAIELMLGLKQASNDLPLEIPHEETSSDLAVTASPNATRRSTRARRKPAPPGPCSLLSTPLSALSSPATPDATPLPESPEKRSRSGSRGSSTAVSDGGYPSEEGTVVDIEIEPATSVSTKGKRKAAEMEEATPEPAVTTKGSKSKARKPAARKRAKVVDQQGDLMQPVDDATVPQDVGIVGGEGESPEIAPASPAAPPAPVAKKRKTATSGGKRKTARARA